MSRLSAALHVDSADSIVVDHAVSHELPYPVRWVMLAGETTVFCDDASTAEAIAEAFREMAKGMRADRHVPEPDLFEPPFPDSLSALSETTPEVAH